MTEETKQYLIAATLAWCNNHRRRKGMESMTELPKGLIRKGDSCPCGKATKMHVAYSIAIDLTDGDETYNPVNGSPKPHYDLPPSVQQFVDAFDHGLFPELVAEGSMRPHTIEACPKLYENNA